MPLFIIERNFAEAIELDGNNPDIKRVNDEAGISWLYSFLSADRKKTYCLYEAPNAESIREAADRLQIPADRIMEVNAPVGPVAAPA